MAYDYQINYVCLKGWHSFLRADFEYEVNTPKLKIVDSNLKNSDKPHSFPIFSFIALFVFENIKLKDQNFNGVKML